MEISRSRVSSRGLMVFNGLVNMTHSIYNVFDQTLGVGSTAQFILTHSVMNMNDSKLKASDSSVMTFDNSTITTTNNASLVAFKFAQVYVRNSFLFLSGHIQAQQDSSLEIVNTQIQIENFGNFISLGSNHNATILIESSTITVVGRPSLYANGSSVFQILDSTVELGVSFRINSSAHMRIWNSVIELTNDGLVRATHASLCSIHTTKFSILSGVMHLFDGSQMVWENSNLFINNPSMNYSIGCFNDSNLIFIQTEFMIQSPNSGMGMSESCHLFMSSQTKGLLQGPLTLRNQAFGSIIQSQLSIVTQGIVSLMELSVLNLNESLIQIDGGNLLLSHHSQLNLNNLSALKIIAGNVSNCFFFFSN